MRVVRNTIHFGRLRRSWASGVALAVRCYNELSKYDCFCIPRTNARSAQIQVTNHKNADRLMVGREEVAMEKCCC